MATSTGRTNSSAYTTVIRVCGSVVVESEARPERAKRAATRELIAYLALNKDGGTRDELLELLWPGCNPEKTRPRFWQSIAEARRLLRGALARNANRYVLDRTRVRVDSDLVEAFVKGAATTRTLLADTSVFRGPPLADVDGVWAVGHRRQLTATVVVAAERLAQELLERSQPTAALELAEFALRLDDLNERLWRLAMQAEADLGLRTAVATRYRLVAERLDTALGIGPSRETRALQLRLLAQG